MLPASGGEIANRKLTPGATGEAAFEEAAQYAGDPSRGATALITAPRAMQARAAAYINFALPEAPAQGSAAGKVQTIRPGSDKGPLASNHFGAVWFHGKINRGRAEELIKNAAASSGSPVEKELGRFLVRENDQGSYTLSFLRDTNTVEHCRIQFSDGTILLAPALT